MEKINVTDDALPILKSGIALKEKILELKAKDYQERKKFFEEKHGMKSSEFLRKYKSGALGDDEEWLDWLFVHEAYSKIRKQKKIIKELLA